MDKSRRDLLQEFLQNNPNDAFARYGLAMEEMREGSTQEALAQFRLVIEQHPDYSAAYHQAGQLLIAAGEIEQARTMLQQGIQAARRQGNAHASGEMQGLLDEIGG